MPRHLEMRAGSDRISLVRDGGSGIEAIHASFAGHAYDLHRHDDWLVGVTDRGVQDFFCRGERRKSTPGRIILIEPEEAHDGRAGSEDGFAYRMLYLPRAWLKTALMDAAGGDPAFSANLTDDARLAEAIRRAHDALAQPEFRLVRDGLLDLLLDRLRIHLDRVRPARGPDSDGPVASRARQLLHDCLDEETGADALARMAGAASRFQLARAFRAAYGTSPHAYLVQIRLVTARRLLAGGQAPAHVAAACGFADQSHFGRWFRRAYGLTPAAYRACCTDVPDKDVLVA